jgi:riboflavin synthase
MFTGIIEKICSVKSVSRSGSSMLLTIDLGELAEESKIGDSIAINGVCLTIAGLERSLAKFELSAETLTKSTLVNLQPSAKVNIERPLKLSDRFGGHFVLGHVDGTAIIKSIDRNGEYADMTFSAGPELLSQMVAKGSVAVDGISLTIASMDRMSFSVAIIPETLKRTTLSGAKIGDSVNIETDIIIKTIKKQLDSALGGLSGSRPLTMEKLKQSGF